MLSSLVAAALAAAAPEHEPPRIVYTCRHRATEFAWAGGGEGVLELEKRFAEDGTVLAMTVRWEDGQGSFVRRHEPRDRAMATLSWPGRQRVASELRPFEWGEGSISITLLTLHDAARSERPERGERWRQTFVDRNDSLLVYTDSEGRRSLFPNLLDLNLASDVHELASPGRLTSGLDALIAWGRGARRVTVYETLVTRRRPPPNSSPSHPLGRRRIVRSYDLDIPALELLVQRIRREAETWENGLSDFRASCERGEEETGVIILT